MKGGIRRNLIKPRWGSGAVQRRVPGSTARAERRQRQSKAAIPHPALLRSKVPMRPGRGRAADARLREGGGGSSPPSSAALPAPAPRACSGCLRRGWGGTRTRAHPGLCLGTSVVAASGNRFLLLVFQNSVFCGFSESTRHWRKLQMFFITGHVLMGCSSGGSVAASGLSLATLLGSSGIKPGSRPGAQRLLLRPGLVLERQRREQSTQHLSSGPCQGRVLAPTSIAPATQQVGARAGSQVAALRRGKSSRRKKGSKQTEILCTVNCLRFLPCSPGRAAPLPSPAPFLAKRKRDDETCCFFSCCAYKPFSLLQAGGGDGCPSSSSVAGWGWSPEPETSPSPLFPPGRLPACLLPFCLPP